MSTILDIINPFEALYQNRASDYPTSKVSLELLKTPRPAFGIDDFLTTMLSLLSVAVTNFGRWT